MWHRDECIWLRGSMFVSHTCSDAAVGRVVDQVQLTPESVSNC